MPVSFGPVAAPPLAYMPTVSVQISFTAPFATPSWVDITPWVQGFKTISGRQHELLRNTPATCTITLDNRDARFNSWNTTGPYAGFGNGLVPEMPLRIQATWSGVTYNIYYGYIDSWVPVYLDALSTDITIQASDILALLGVADMLSTQYSGQVATDNPSAYYRMNESAGLVCADTIAGNNGVYQGTVQFLVPGALTGDPDPAVDLAGTGYITLPVSLAPTGNNSFTWAIWVNLNAPPPPDGYALIVANSTSSQQQVGLALEPTYVLFYLIDSAGTQSFAFGCPLPPSGGWHQIVATYAGSSASLYVDGVLSTSTPATGHVGLGAPTQFDVGAFPGSNLAPLNARVDELALFPAALTASQIQAHFQLGGFAYTNQRSGDRFRAVCSAVGVPSSLVYAPNPGDTIVQGATSSLGNTKVADYLQTLRDTEQGELFQQPSGPLAFTNRHWLLTNALSNTSQATFEDSATATLFYNIADFAPGLDNLDLWNEVVASAQPGLGTQPVPSGAPQVYRNTASIAKYGKRSHPQLSGVLTTTDQEVLALAQWIGLLYSTPLPRIRSIGMDSAINAGGDLPQMLGRQQTERITVIYHGQNGGTAFQQDSYIEGIEHDVKPDLWKTVWRLSPANTTSYLILDNATAGKLDSGNHLAY